MITFSEIETTTKRASKAAGYSWGVAEEIGKSIRSLELFGLPGIINLNQYLKKKIVLLIFGLYQKIKKNLELLIDMKNKALN